MDFSMVIGQDKIVASMFRAFQEDKIANAYLIDGPVGFGKKLIARLFAMLLNCYAPTEHGPCGTCISCRKAVDLNHPNISYIAPIGATIKIAQIQMVISSISRMANERGKKVVIIENAEKMTVEAQNAFLKTLEEPPDNTIFLLLTTNYRKLLVTIQSRCQRLKLLPVKRELIESYLKERYEDSDKVHIAAINAKGSIGHAMDIMEDDHYFVTRNQYTSLLDLLLKGSAVLLGKSLDGLLKSRNDALALTEYFLEFYRDVMLYKEMDNGAETYLFYANQREIIENHAFSLTNEGIRDIIEKIRLAIGQIEQNVNFYNSIDNMLFSIREVYHGKSSWNSV